MDRDVFLAGNRDPRGDFDLVEAPVKTGNRESE
jgi:hypothetical protein